MPRANHNKLPILFSDAFNVDKQVIDDFGALDISIVTDLPLFIDPFLLFNSDLDEYKDLHDQIIKYLKFLRSKSMKGKLDSGKLTMWYRFKEVKQTWLGFSTTRNNGRGLGRDFAAALNENFSQIFRDYGDEKITEGTHLEKLCLIQEGVGRDQISDFTTNLIKHYLLEYSQNFAKKHLGPSQVRTVAVEKSRFNYQTESWTSEKFVLPWYKNDYVILVPKDLLTKDDTWINRGDLIRNFEEIPNSIGDDALRTAVNNFIMLEMPSDPSKEDKLKVINRTFNEFPDLIDYFIRFKEENGDEAVALSDLRVAYANNLFIDKFAQLPQLLADRTNFYQLNPNAHDEALQRVHYLRHVIENCDGYRLFHDKGGKPVKREEDLQIAFKFVWYDSLFDVNREVNNGRGPVDFKVSKGPKDVTLVEFKLASNSKLRRNLQNQVQVYEKANTASNSIKVIMYFTEIEYIKVTAILDELVTTQAGTV